MTHRTLAATAGLLALVSPSLVVHAAAQTTAERLTQFTQRAHDLGLAPGLAVAIVHGDSVVLLEGFGYADVARGRPVTAETVFYIASATKPFLGLTAAVLDARGALDLDRPLAEYLPAADLHAELSADAITLRDLLTHTHGISNDGPLTFRSAYSGAGPHDEMVALLADHGPASDGRSFRYGNIGYNVASLAMDATLGRSWKDVLAEQVLTPLGMGHTTGYVSRVARDRLALPYGVEAVGFAEQHYAKVDANMHGAGGLVTTARDLATWLEAHINQGQLDGRQVLPAEVFAEAHRPHAPESGSFRQFTREGYGLGWHVGHYDGDVLLHHFGGFNGFHAHVSFMPERRIGVAALANDASLGGALAELVARYAYDLLLEKPGIEEKYEQELNEYAGAARQRRQRVAADRARRAARPQSLPRPLSAYAGDFENSSYGRLTLAVVGDRLEATMGPLWSRVEVYDAQREALRVELTGGGVVMQFTFDDQGEAQAVEVSGIRLTRVR
jgi:CubicO group peptidase (beta-lactamase class C family)